MIRKEGGGGFEGCGIPRATGGGKVQSIFEFLRVRGV